MRWVLKGRQLTVRLPSRLAVLARGRRSTSRVSVRGAPLAVSVLCGDDTTVGGNGFIPETIWADVVAARVHVARRSRRVRVLFGRDLARRTNACELTVRPASDHPAHHWAGMVLRRGTPVGCRPGRRERVILRQGPVRVTRSRLDLGDESSVTAYRACLAPRGALRAIEDGADIAGGSSGLLTRPRLFRAAGTWLAWTTITVDSAGFAPPHITAIDLNRAQPATGISAGAGSDHHGGGAVITLTIARDGTLAWILDQQQGYVAPSTPAPPALLYAKRAAGTLTQLDKAPTARQLGAPTIDADHNTITWTHDGTPRSQTLPP